MDGLQGVAISYIYTFAVSTNKLAFPTLSDINLDAISDAYESLGRQRPDAGLGTPPSEGKSTLLGRTGLCPYLSLRDQDSLLYIQFPVQEAVVRSHNEPFRAQLYVTIRVTSAGAGVVTISIWHRSHRIAPERAFDLLTLMEQEPGKSSTYALELGDTPSTSLRELFWRETETFIRAARESGSLEPSHAVSHGISHIRWIDEEFLTVDNRRYPMQSPFWVTFLEFEQDSYRSIFKSRTKDYTLLGGAIDPTHEELLKLLFGVYRPTWLNGSAPDQVALRAEIDTAAIRSELLSGTSKLTNRNFMLLPHIVFHYRSCLTSLVSLNGESERIVLPSLLDMFELLRMQWHCFVLANAYLDSLATRIGTSPVQNESEEAEFGADVLNDLIGLRTKMTRLLQRLDGYRWGGNSLSPLHDRAMEAFSLDELRSTAIEKLKMVERLYSLVLDRNWRLDDSRWN